MRSRAWNAVRFEPIVSQALLLVEGPDDDRFFTALLRQNGATSVRVRLFGGLGSLSQALLALPPTEGYSRLRWLGIVVDADASSQRRFADVARWMEEAGRQRRPLRFPTPRRPWEATTDEFGRSTVVFVLPHDASSGDLETWLLSAVGHREQSLCAQAFADCLGSAAPRQRSKLVMAAYLAAHDPEKLRIGDAIQNAGVLPLVHDMYRPFLDLIPTDDIAP